MKARLNRNGRIVSDFDFIPHTYGYDLRNVRIIDINAAPYEWVLFMKHSEPNEDEWELYITKWIQLRMIPFTRRHLDEYIRILYYLTYPGYGRMQGYRSIPAICHNFMSPFDQYSITPEKDCSLYFGVEDYFFDQTIRCMDLRKYRSDLSQIANEKEAVCAWHTPTVHHERYIPTGEICFSSSMHSVFPTWVEVNGEKIYVKQKIKDWELKDENSIPNRIFDTTKELKLAPKLTGPDEVSIDITDIYGKADTIWFYNLEIDPFCQKGTEDEKWDIKKEALSRYSDSEESVEAVRTVLEKIGDFH